MPLMLQKSTLEYGQYGKSSLTNILPPFFKKQYLLRPEIMSITGQKVIRSPPQTFGNV
jgi:hypothetical protein